MGKMTLLNSEKLSLPSLLTSCLLNSRKTSSWVKLWKFRTSFKPDMMSWTEIFPEPLVSKSLKQSKRLKSGLRETSILADSSSLSKKMVSFKTLANSAYSILSYWPKFIPAFLGGSYSANDDLAGDYWASVPWFLLGDLSRRGDVLPFWMFGVPELFR